MPMHPNFETRSVGEIDAALAAIMSVLRVVLEKQQLDTDRVQHLLTIATGDDVNVRARARWFVDWMAGNLTTEGERS